MNINHQAYGEALLLTVNESRVDAAVAIQFKDKVRELAGDGPNRVVMDMTQVNFLDSSGLGALVAAMKQLGPDRQLELAGLSQTVSKVFRLTRMDSVFVVHKEAKDAITDLSDGS